MSCENCYGDGEAKVVADSNMDWRFICLPCLASAQPLRVSASLPPWGWEFPDMGQVALVREAALWRSAVRTVERVYYRHPESVRADVLLPRLEASP